MGSQLIQNGLVNNYNAMITKLMLTTHGYRDKAEADHTTDGKPIAGFTRGNTMRPFLIAFVFLWFVVPFKADAQTTIERRLRAVEKKTDYYELKKFSRSRTWQRTTATSPAGAPRAAMDTSIAPSGCSVEVASGGQERLIRCVMNIAVDSSLHPVIATIWVQWSLSV